MDMQIWIISSILCLAGFMLVQMFPQHRHMLLALTRLGIIWFILSFFFFFFCRRVWVALSDSMAVSLKTPSKRSHCRWTRVSAPYEWIIRSYYKNWNMTRNSSALWLRESWAVFRQVYNSVSCGARKYWRPRPISFRWRAGLRSQEQVKRGCNKTLPPAKRQTQVKVCFFPHIQVGRFRHYTVVRV